MNATSAADIIQLRDHDDDDDDVMRKARRFTDTHGLALRLQATKLQRRNIALVLIVICSIFDIQQRN